MQIVCGGGGEYSRIIDINEKGQIIPERFVFAYERMRSQFGAGLHLRDRDRVYVSTECDNERLHSRVFLCVRACVRACVQFLLIIITIRALLPRARRM